MLNARHLRHPVRAARGAGQLLRLHLGALRRARTGQQRYKDDPRFRLDAVEQGFRPPASSSQPHDEELLRRICGAYRAASHSRAAELYTPTQWWAAIRRASLGQVIRALEAGDLDDLHYMYANFFRDRCSDGLVGKNVLLDPSLSRTLARVHQSVYLTETLANLETWKILTSNKFGLKDLIGPDTGNPFGVELDGTLVRTGAAYQHYCADRINGLLPDKEAVIVEI